MQKILISFVIGLLIGVGVLYGLQYQKSALSPQEAGEKAIEFINKMIQEDVTVSLAGVEEESGVYKIDLKIEDSEYTSYITKDGKILFSQGFVVESEEEPQKESQAEAVSLYEFAKCLTEKEVKFYGAWWCPHCQNQKDMFGDSFQYVNYIECEEEPDVSRGSMTEICQAAEITSFPTWDFADGTRKTGEIPLENLSELSGCPLK